MTKKTEDKIYEVLVDMLKFLVLDSDKQGMEHTITELRAIFKAFPPDSDLREEVNKDIVSLTKILDMHRDRGIALLEKYK